jgi:hypothetical protein
VASIGATSRRSAGAAAALARRRAGSPPGAHLRDAGGLRLDEIRYAMQVLAAAYPEEDLLGR